MSYTINDLNKAVQIINALAERCGELAMGLETNPNLTPEMREFLEKASTHAHISTQLIARMGKAISAVKDEDAIQVMQEAAMSDEEIVVPWWEHKKDGVH